MGPLQLSTFCDSVTVQAVGGFLPEPTHLVPTASFSMARAGPLEGICVF